jgi:hypothetical protein
MSYFRISSAEALSEDGIIFKELIDLNRGSKNTQDGLLKKILG